MQRPWPRHEVNGATRCWNKDESRWGCLSGGFSYGVFLEGYPKNGWFIRKQSQKWMTGALGLVGNLHMKEALDSLSENRMLSIDLSLWNGHSGASQISCKLPLWHHGRTGDINRHEDFSTSADIIQAYAAISWWQPRIKKGNPPWFTMVCRFCWTYGAFDKWTYPNSWMVFLRENLNLKWMIKWGTPMTQETSIWTWLRIPADP